MKARIIERTYENNTKVWVIQQKHFLFRWIWVDASINSWDFFCEDSFNNIEKARKNLCYFDGTKVKEKVVS